MKLKSDNMAPGYKLIILQ